MSFQLWRRTSDRRNSLKIRAGVIFSVERVIFLVDELACKTKTEKYTQIDPFIDLTTIPKENINVHPYDDKENICVAMTQINLAEPEWMQIPCDKPLASHVFCNRKDYKPHVVNQSLKIYSRSCIFINDKCHIFSWYEFSGSVLNVECGNNSLNTKDYQFLFDAVSVTFPPILLDDFQTVLTHTRYLNIYSFVKHDITEYNNGALYACNTALQNYSVGGNIFQCKGGSYISASYLCDGIIDCPNGNKIDEVGCLCHNTDNYTHKCKHLDEQNKTCSFFYFKNNGKCRIFSFYALSDKNDKLDENFTCGNNITISNKLVNDLIADCGPSAEDEFLLQYSTKTDRIFNCPEPGMLQCI